MILMQILGNQVAGTPYAQTAFTWALPFSHLVTVQGNPSNAAATVLRFSNIDQMAWSFGPLGSGVTLNGLTIQCSSNTYYAGGVYVYEAATLYMNSVAIDNWVGGDAAGLVIESMSRVSAKTISFTNACVAVWVDNSWFRASGFSWSASASCGTAPAGPALGKPTVCLPGINYCFLSLRSVAILQWCPELRSE